MIQRQNEKPQNKLILGSKMRNNEMTKWANGRR